MRAVPHSSKNILRSKKKTFVRTFESSNEDCIRSPLPLHCPQVAATQISAVGVRWKLQLPSRGIETTVTARSLVNDLLTKPARALTVLGALQNHEEGRKKVKPMPTWVNVSQGGSTLHAPEATEKKRRRPVLVCGAKIHNPLCPDDGQRTLPRFSRLTRKQRSRERDHEQSQRLRNLRRKRQSCCRVRIRRLRSSKRLKKMKKEEPPSGDEEEEPPA